MLVPESADRLHVYSGGKLQDVLGTGPGATNDVAQLSLRDEVVVLADNLGRPKNRYYKGQPKGLSGHVYAVKAASLPKPEVQRGRVPDLFRLSGFIPGHRKGENGAAADIVTWTIKPTGKKPLILELNELPVPGMLLINDEPIDFWQNGKESIARYVLEPGVGAFTGGRNKVTLSLCAPLDRRDQLTRHVKLHQVTQVVTQRGQWSFCPWRLPEDSEFEALPSGNQSLPSQPAWFRARFNVKTTSVPLWLEPRGMTKGQIYVNGHNAGRYFMATREGKQVPPQKHYYLPEPWLRTDAPNELLIFDEHGRDPRKCRLVYNAMGPYNSEARAR